MCGGNCGLTFVRTPNKRNQRYAEGCPITKAKREGWIRKGRINQNRKLGHAIPGEMRRCGCKQNCGRTFKPTGYRIYHPDCPWAKNQQPLALADRTPNILCKECFGISDRRPKNRRCACGELFAPEPKPDIIDFLSNKYLPSR
jgi:hypothetical protein